MHTYLRPYEPRLPTRRSIRRVGGVSLNHSLDVRRLVAFLGSGVSAAYGRPTWAELAAILLRTMARTAEEAAWRTARARVVNDESSRASDPAPLDTVAVQEMRQLLEEARVLVNCKAPTEDDALVQVGEERMLERDEAFRRDSGPPNPKALTKTEIDPDLAAIAALARDIEAVRRDDMGDATLILALCERVVELAGRPDAMRRAICWTFRRGGQPLARMAAEGVIEVDPARHDFKTADGEGASEGTGQELREELERLAEVTNGQRPIIANRLITPHQEKFGYLEMALCSAADIANTEAAEAMKVAAAADDDPATTREAPEGAPGGSAALTAQAEALSAMTRQIHLVLGALPDPKRGASGRLVDPLHHLRETLGIKRFLTINYDSEIDSFLRERLGYRQEDPEHLEKATHRLRDGFGGVAEVGDATEDELGRMVAFAALGNPRNVRVLHLHGQHRDPESLILTESDYQRRYYGEPARRRAFRESLDALFTGNSMLFVGVGMNEADLLQPFRQFASLVQDRGGSSPEPRFGQAFALMPLEGETDASRRALELDQRYGVSARFYGKLLPVLMTLIKAVEAALLDKGEAKAVETAEKNLLRNLDRQFPQGPPSIDQLFAALLKDADLLLSDNGGQPDDLTAIIDAEAQIGNHLVALAKSGARWPDVGEASRRTRQFLRLFLDRWRSDIQSRALCAALHELEEKRHRWAMEWRVTPKARQAIFGNIARSPEDAPVWSRHMVDNASFRYQLDDSIDGPLQQALRAQVPETWAGFRGRRILRAALPRGAGKGSILAALAHELTQGPQGEEKAVDDADVLQPRKATSLLFKSLPAREPVSYDGAFLAHGSFSTEFGTVAAALYRFLRVAMLRSHDEATLTNKKTGAESREVTYEAENQAPRGSAPEDARWRYTYMEEDDDVAILGAADRLDLLRDALRQLMDLSPPEQGRRWLIVLSGVDRLCDHGKPVSSAITEFFEVLTDPEFKDCPIDILLISGDVHNGIVGLSESDEDRAGGDRESPAPPAPDPKGRIVVETPARPPWPVIAVPDEKALQGRPWRGGDIENPLPRATLMMHDPADIGAPLYDHERSLPDLCRLMRGRRIIDLWVWRLLADLNKSGRDGLVRFEVRERVMLLQRLNDAARGNRVAGVIDAILSTRGRIERQQEAGPQWVGLKEATLKYLALITTPVERSVLIDIDQVRQRLDYVWRQVTTPRFRAPGEEARKWLQERSGGEQRSFWGEKDSPPRRLVKWRRAAMSQCLKELAEAGLVFKVRPRNPLLGPDEDARYAMHSVLREHLTRKADIPLRDLAQRNLYDVSVHDVLPRDLPTPAQREFKEIASLVSALIEQSSRDLAPWIRWIHARHTEPLTREEAEALLSAFDDETFHGIGRRLKACFSILHGVLSIGAVARLDRLKMEGENFTPPFDLYRNLIRGLLNAATALSVVRDKATGTDAPTGISGKRSSDALRDSAPPAIATKPKDFNDVRSSIALARDPLHLSEIVWLMNERGLVSFIQGRLYDARTLFELARERAAPPIGGRQARDNPTARRIRLNRALAILDAGRIDEARQEFEALNTEEERESTHLARGYLGLCAHLEGRFDTARRYYKKAIGHFDDKNNLRAVASFSCHFADLLRRDRKFDKARERIERAEIAAARQEHRDLLHSALVTHARLIRAEGQESGNAAEAAVKAAAKLRLAEDYARAMGAHRIAADALRGLSELMLDGGETEFAGQLAIEAMAISSMNGMRLRKISAAILYGTVLNKRGQPIYARPILRQALEEAERCGYQLRAGRAADALHEVEAKLRAARGKEARPPTGPNA